MWLPSLKNKAENEHFTFSSGKSTRKLLYKTSKSLRWPATTGPVI